MLRAVLRMDGDTASAVAESLGPESGRELPRTRSSISMDGGSAVVSIEAADASAMRAALNSYLECVIVVQNVEHIAKVRQ
ncbi:MAG: KEOPS complex subunit Pcc1 [Thermoplasmata archaeon]|nr:KEOPS complex subunit Pcc1 [Thermoplasmata archaeon]